MTILNCGCGVHKLPDCINVDLQGKPDIRADILRLPIKSDSVDKIYLFHTIEHIEKIKHFDLFFEFRRVLREGGEVIVSYPEFTICAKFFIDNYKGMREFWEKTIYGRQSTPDDFHVSLMYTPWFKNFLRDVGFDNIREFLEPGQECNTVVKCKKGEKPLTKVERYKRDFFGAN